MARPAQNRFSFFEPVSIGRAGSPRRLWGYEGEPELKTPAATPVRSLLSARRLFSFYVAVVATLAILVLRLVLLQLQQGTELRAAAEENRLRIRLIPSTRGIFYDRRGEPLVRNIADQALFMTPADLPNAKALQDIAGRLSSILGEEREQLLRDIDASRPSLYESVLLREHLPYETALRIRIVEATLPGFHVETTAIREYLGGNAFSHLLGYTGKIAPEEEEQKLEEDYALNDQIGKSGLERSYEQLLRGSYGRKSVEVDSLGKEKRIVASDPPVVGSSLSLTIDAVLQRRASELLNSMMDERHATGGGLVALDPRNGDVLALVSTPSFDNNEFSGGIKPDAFEQLKADKRNPFFFRPVAGQYPSGSTIKPFVAAGALAEGVITPSTTVLSSGGIQIGKWFFPDWQAGGHGTTDVKKAIAQSVNTFFYMISGGTDTFQGLGIARLAPTLQSFGFGEPTGVDLDGEAVGLVPTPAWKEATKRERWYIGDTYHLAIGQGDILVTPIQMAQATAAVANGGTLYQPRLVQVIQGTSGAREERQPESRRNGLANPQSLAVVRGGMREAVLSGSARSLQTLPVSSAGKTGTAQFGTGERTHSWFTSFAPYENPEIVVVVVLEGGGEGHEAALPVARELLRSYFSQKKNTESSVENKLDS